MARLLSIASSSRPLCYNPSSTGANPGQSGSFGFGRVSSKTGWSRGSDPVRVLKASVPFFSIRLSPGFGLSLSRPASVHN